MRASSVVKRAAAIPPGRWDTLASGENGRRLSDLEKEQELS